MPFVGTEIINVYFMDSTLLRHRAVCAATARLLLIISADHPEIRKWSLRARVISETGVGIGSGDFGDF